MACATLRQSLLQLSDETKDGVSDLLSAFRSDLSDEHQDLLQEISFKVGLLTSAITDGEMPAADVDRHWREYLARRQESRTKRAAAQAEAR